MKKILICIATLTFFSNCANACVTINSTTQKYTVDGQGYVQIPE